MYLSKLQNEMATGRTFVAKQGDSQFVKVFVQIDKCICFNLTNIFFQITKWDGGRYLLLLKVLIVIY